MPCINHGQNCDGKECINPNIDNGMMTKVWGPAGWLFLHCVAAGYPYVINPDKPEHLEKQNDYYRFFYYLGKVFPCKYCRNSYQDFITDLSPINHLGSRKKLCKWLYDIHNKVNDKLGVPACEIPSFEDVEKNYEQFRAKCTPTTENEKTANKAKGCVIPANGKPSRSVIKVVEFKPSDSASSPTNPNSQEFPKSNDYIVINKTSLAIGISVFFIILLLCIIYFVNKHYKYTKKL
jgi:hypothetical protein